MGVTLARLIPDAIGLWISPVALVETILVLFTARARANGPVFVGCYAGATVLAFLLGAVGISAAGSGGEKSTAARITLLVLAGLLLWAAIANFAKRADRTPPAVFATIESMGVAAVAVLGATAVLLNPKNLLVALGAGSQAADSTLSGMQLLVVGVVFALIAAVPNIALVGYLLLGGEGAQRHALQWKTALLDHNRVIVAVVLAVLSVSMIANALAA